MRSPLRLRFALLVAGLGLTAAIATAGPQTDRGTPSPKSQPAAKVQAKPAPDLPKPPAVLPKADPKPLPPPMKVEPKVPVTLPRPEPKPLPLPPTADPKPTPKPGTVPPLVVKPDLGPVKTPLPKITPKPTTPTLPPETKLPGKGEPRPVIVHEKPKIGTPVSMPKGPGLKLPGGTKVDPGELAKIKPPVDLTKTKPEKVLAAKPPADFKVKPIGLDKIHVPQDAAKVEKLNITTVSASQAFVLNKSVYAGGDYHTKFGKKVAAGYYCYPGKHHCHWHHCVWDPCFGSHYYYCPSASCYYYWCATDYCYHPCHWFVDYGSCYYPWWICGGFGGYGYVAKPHISIFIGW